MLEHDVRSEYLDSVLFLLIPVSQNCPQVVFKKILVQGPGLFIYYCIVVDMFTEKLIRKSSNYIQQLIIKILNAYRSFNLYYC